MNMDEFITLKKYSNRRLYDTRQSAYVTLEDVARMIKMGYGIAVIDAKTQQDVTGPILTQIIMDQTKKNPSLLPIPLLHLIIRFGEDLLSEFFEKYLEQSIRSYLSYKKSMEEQFRLCLELGFDLSAMTEQTFRTMNPFYPWSQPRSKPSEDEPSAADSPGHPPSEEMTPPSDNPDKPPGD